MPDEGWKIDQRTALEDHRIFARTVLMALKNAGSYDVWDPQAIREQLAVVRALTSLAHNAVSLWEVYQKAVDEEKEES